MNLKILVLMLLLSYDNSYFYKLNKNRNRTSSLFKKGNIVGKVIKENDKNQLKLNVYIKTLFNELNAKKVIDIKEEFYQAEFWENLRSDKIIMYDEFTIIHLEQIDNCDNVLIKDFKEEDDLKDAQMTSVICHLDDFKPLNIDVRGIYRGYKYKAGFDLIK